MPRGRFGTKDALVSSGFYSTTAAAHERRRQHRPKTDTERSACCDSWHGRPLTCSASLLAREDPMKNFLVLYMASGAEFEKMIKNSTPEQQKKGMDAWMKWMNTNKTSIVEGGAPLGKTKRVDSNGASNTRNEIGGYSVVQAESHDAATKIFGKDHPHLQMPGAWIEIVEIMPMPGM
jgi:hypothetical protein